MAKEDITVQVRSGSGTETSPGGIRGGGGLAGHHQAIQPHPFQAKKNFTTFAALNKKVVEPSTPDTSRSSSSSLILQPATAVVAFEEIVLRIFFSETYFDNDSYYMSSAAHKKK